MRTGVNGGESSELTGDPGNTRARQAAPPSPPVYSSTVSRLLGNLPVELVFQLLDFSVLILFKICQGFSFPFSADISEHVFYVVKT